MNTIERFSSRAQSYARHRPRYPAWVVETLEREAGLAARSLVADVGAGTGLSSEPFLAHGHRVIALEPNEAMRAEMKQHGSLHVVGARGEELPLQSASVDALVCAQAFHWLDRQAAREEFLRVVRLGGLIVLMWNLRLEDTSGFANGLEELLVRLGVEYATRVRPETAAAVEGVAQVFEPRSVTTRVHRHAQALGWDELEGRVRSMSFVPLEGQEHHGRFFEELRALYERQHQQGGVVMDYDCHLSWVRR